MRPRRLGGLAALLVAGALAAPAQAQSPCRGSAIRSPFRGAVLTGTESILGSAGIDDFSYYKLEWAPESSPDAWSAVSTTKPDRVINGLLDEWDTSRLPDGPVRLRLVVVNSAAQEVCTVVVTDLTIANAQTAAATVAATDTPALPTEGPAAGTESTASADTEDEAAPTAPADSTAAPEPVATLKPILPAASAGRDLLAPANLVKAARLGDWASAFLKGFAAAWVLALVALAVGAYRQGR